MKLFETIFGKRYLDWEEYQERIKTLDKKPFKKEENINLSS